MAKQSMTFIILLSIGLCTLFKFNSFATTNDCDILIYNISISGCDCPNAKIIILSDTNTVFQLMPVSIDKQINIYPNIKLNSLNSKLVIVNSGDSAIYKLSDYICVNNYISISFKSFKIAHIGFAEIIYNQCFHKYKGLDIHKFNLCYKVAIISTTEYIISNDTGSNAIIYDSPCW